MFAGVEIIAASEDSIASSIFLNTLYLIYGWTLLYSYASGTSTWDLRGTWQFAGDFNVAQYIKHTGDTNNHISFTTDRQDFVTDGVAALTIDSAQSAIFSGTVVRTATNNSAGTLWTAIGDGNVPHISIQNASTTNNKISSAPRTKKNGSIFFKRVAVEGRKNKTVHATSAPMENGQTPIMPEKAKQSIFFKRVSITKKETSSRIMNKKISN